MKRIELLLLHIMYAVYCRLRLEEYVVVVVVVVVGHSLSTNSSLHSNQAGCVLPSLLLCFVYSFVS